MIGQVLRAKISVEIKFRRLLSFCSRKNGKTRKIKTWLILGSINFQNNFSKRSTREISLLPKSFFKFYSSSKQKYFIFTIYIYYSCLQRLFEQLIFHSILDRDHLFPSAIRKNSIKDVQPNYTGLISISFALIQGGVLVTWTKF